MEKWKIIEETDISPSKWFPIKKHKVKLPNGKIIDDYYITDLNNVGMVLPITTKNEVVLVKLQNPEENGHPFRFKADRYSGAKRTPILF